MKTPWKSNKIQQTGKGQKVNNIKQNAKDETRNEAKDATRLKPSKEWAQKGMKNAKDIK